VERAIALLRCFDGVSGAISLTDLARRTGLRVSTAHRIVRALVRGDLLDQDPVTERYRLGRAFVILGQAAGRGFGLDVVRPELDRLAEVTDESAGLGVREGDDVVIAVSAQSNQSLRFDQPAGSRLRLHASAMGKALLAFASPDIKDTVASLGSLPKYTTTTVTRRAALVDELRTVREQGFAINFEERYVGVSGVAAPIVDDHGCASAAVGIRGPAARLDAGRIRELAPRVIATAQAIGPLLSLERL
jgi:IclR family acetate operon transcriptional repressor